MYLTAQRVRSTDLSREGINVFLYVHDEDEAARSNWQKPDLEEIASSNPGRLVVELVAVTPGSNDVTSYIDAVFPEGKSINEVRDSIQTAAALYPGPTAWSAKSVWIRYYANEALHPDLASEFNRLKDKLLLVLGSATGGGDGRCHTSITASEPVTNFIE